MNILDKGEPGQDCSSRPQSGFRTERCPLPRRENIADPLQLRLRLQL